MAVSREVESYGRHSVAVNAAWARRFGHELLVHTGGRPADGREYHGAIVGALLEAVRTAPEEVGWILRLDCDAVLADFEQDQLSRLVEQHPDAQVLLSAAVGQMVSEPSPFNFGVVLLRRSSYTRALLEEMWHNPYLKRGVDQDLFALMHKANWSGLAGVTAVLPETAMNSARVAVTAPPAQQPIYHLWGHSDDVREAFLAGAFRQLCDGRRALDLNATYLEALNASAHGELHGDAVPIAGEVRAASSSWRAWRLAAALSHWGDLAGAEHWWRAGLRLSDEWPPLAPQEQLTMWDHLQALFAGLELTQLLDSQGRHAEAHPVALRTVEGCQRQLQEPFVRLREECASLQGSLGRSLLDKARAEEAVPHLRAAWQGCLGLHGEGALTTARAADSLATALLQASQSAHGEALLLLRAAAPAFGQLPEGDGERLLFRANLGVVLEALGHVDEAAAEFGAVLRSWTTSTVQLPASRLYDVRPLLRALTVATGASRGGVHGMSLLEVMVRALPEAHPQAAWWRQELRLAVEERRGQAAEAEALGAGGLRAA